MVALACVPSATAGYAKGRRPPRLVPAGAREGGPMEQTQDKPARWAAARATAFEDQSVVDRYHLRPPYPQAVLDTLAELAAVAPRTVLDVGAGTGELARRLVRQVARLDALDRSAAMIARGRTLPGGDHPRLC